MSQFPPSGVVSVPSLRDSRLIFIEQRHRVATPPPVDIGARCFTPFQRHPASLPPPPPPFAKLPVRVAWSNDENTRQVHNQLGETPPDVEDFKPLVAAFKATQALLDT